jgi:hypothetical protein
MNPRQKFILVGGLSSRWRRPCSTRPYQWTACDRTEIWQSPADHGRAHGAVYAPLGRGPSAEAVRAAAASRDSDLVAFPEATLDEHALLLWLGGIAVVILIAVPVAS